MSSSVKVMTTESEAGTLQMFLVHDMDSDVGVESLSKISCSTGNLNPAVKNYQENSCKNVSILHKENDTQDPDSEKLSENKLRAANANSFDKPSRRSLRLKAGKRPLTYRISSEDESFDTDALTYCLKTAVAKTSRSSKTHPSDQSSSCASNSTKPYSCDECSMSCKTAGNLKQHKQTHLEVKPFICATCGYSCKRKSDLKKHEETHGSKNAFKCSECDYSGKRLKYLKKHMRIHNKEASFSCHLCQYRSHIKGALDNHLTRHSDLRPHSCVLCGEGFKLKWALKKHMVTHSNISPYPCDICGAAFKRKDHLKKHESLHKSGVKTRKPPSKDAFGGEVLNGAQGVHDEYNSIKTEYDEDDDSSDATIITENPSESIKEVVTPGFLKTRGGSVQCTTCNYYCGSINVLRRHMRGHSDSKPFTCQQCGASFKRKDHLEVHKFTHSDSRPHKCPHCSYGTHRRYRLKLHILTHQTLKPISCPACVYKCRRYCELRYHMRNKHRMEVEPKGDPEPKLENGGAELRCDKCDYTCDSLKRLKYHMERHDNKTPHSCPHCDYKCSSRSSLTDHLLRHAGIKPCLCSICGMAFRNTSRLNRHKLVHSDVKPYGCEFCDFSSRSKYNLKQHTLRHTDQEKSRRRNRKPSKPKENKQPNPNKPTTEVIKQSYQTDIPSILGQMSSNIFLETVHPQQDMVPTFPEILDHSKFPASQVSMTSHYLPRDQQDMSELVKARGKQVDQSLYHHATYQSQSTNINPFQVERQCGSAMISSAYPETYQRTNPFLGQGNPVTYNPGINLVHGNTSFGFVDRNGSGCANPYFYNETVFPGNMNPNMYLYMGPSTSNMYPVNPGPVLPMMHQNMSDINTHIPARTIPHPSSMQSAPEAVSQQQLADPDDDHLGDMSQSDDVSGDLPFDHRCNGAPKKSKSQTKKTGATLDGGKSNSKSDSDSSSKQTHICVECGYICLTNTMLQRHKTTHLDLKPHKCEECGKLFKRRDHMKAHKRTHGVDKPFTCDHCSYTCSRKYRLKAHEKTHINEQLYCCSVCEATFHTAAELKDHMQIHDEGFMFACEKCDFKCKEKSDMTLHNETHKTFLCEKCSYVCRSSREFSSHKKMHAEKEELTCSICNYTCDSQKRLKYHLERHENKTPHACPQCDYKCSSRSSLSDHLLQHEGIKPFLCSACGMRFRNVSRLNRHKLTHTDIKPYSCDYCSFSSRSRYNLKQHMSRHFK